MVDLTLKLFLRFAARIRVNGECWEWTGAKTPDGYGMMYLETTPDGKRVGCSSHRVAYMWAVGSIAKGLEIDHLCRNRACCNPAHLEAVTPQINTHRSFAPAGINARKTHCGKCGRPFDMLVDKRRTHLSRACSVCRKAMLSASNARAYAKRKQRLAGAHS